MSIPVLMYHHVNENKGDMVTVTPEIFELQIRYLSKSGFNTISVDNLIRYIRGEISLPKQSVLITFDDGYLDNYVYAFPVLKKYGIKATIFLVTSWVEESSKFKVQSSKFNIKRLPEHRECKRLIKDGREHEVIINWNMAKEMVESGLVDIYSHTHTHRGCSLSDGMDEDRLREELVTSKRLIEERLGVSCTYLCWPMGVYDDSALRAARDAGYNGVFTTAMGVVDRRSAPFAIPRIAIKDKGIWWFGSRIGIYTNPLLSWAYP